jgi:hypothetical protein
MMLRNLARYTDVEKLNKNLTPIFDILFGREQAPEGEEPHFIKLVKGIAWELISEKNGHARLRGLGSRSSLWTKRYSH